MRNLDSVLFEIDRDTSTAIAIRPIANQPLAAIGKRLSDELRLLAFGGVKLAFVAALSFGLAWLFRQLYLWPPATDYTAAVFVPVFGIVASFLWPTSLRLIIEPRRVSAPTLLMTASMAYAAAWVARSYVVAEPLATFEWIIAERAADLGALSAWTLPSLALEMVAVVVAGLALTRKYLGPQRSASRV